MRTRDQILDEAVRAASDIRKRSMLECFYLRLGIEVLTDIRDLLKTFTEQHKDHWELYHPPKKGGE